jgi:hypothetical protein
MQQHLIQVQYTTALGNDALDQICFRVLGNYYNSDPFAEELGGLKQQLGEMLV